MTNALSSSIQFFSNFFKCADSSVVQPKSQSKHFFFSMPRNVNEAPVLLEGKTLKEAAGMCKELQDAVTKKIAPFQDSRVDGPTRQALGRDALKRALAQACEEV